LSDWTNRCQLGLNKTAVYNIILGPVSFQKEMNEILPFLYCKNEVVKSLTKVCFIFDKNLNTDQIDCFDSLKPIEGKKREYERR
jgi:hypothetical protein